MAKKARIPNSNSKSVSDARWCALMEIVAVYRGIAINLVKWPYEIIDYRWEPSNELEACLALEAESSSTHSMAVPADCNHESEDHPEGDWFFGEQDHASLMLARLNRYSGSGDLDDELFCSDAPKNIRARLARIRDPELLAWELLVSCAWVIPDLKQQVKKACSGEGKYSLYLSEKVGEFSRRRWTSKDENGGEQTVKARRSHAVYLRDNFSYAKH